MNEKKVLSDTNIYKQYKRLKENEETDTGYSSAL